MKLAQLQQVIRQARSAVRQDLEIKLAQLKSAARRVLVTAEADAPEGEKPAAFRWIVLFLSLAISAGIALRLGQDISWDVKNYHYYSGYAFLNKPLGYDFAPAQVQSFFNPLLHASTYLMLEYLPAKAAAALVGALQGLNFYLLFLICQVLFRRWKRPYRYLIGLGNAAAGYYGTIGIMELGATFGDTLVSILVLAGLLLVFRCRSNGGTEEAQKCARMLAASGVIIGVAFALKLTVIIHVVAIAVAIPFALRATRRRIRLTLVFCAGLAVGFCAAYGIWGLHLYREYQNPLFPYMNNVFRSPYYDLENTMDARFLPRNWRETLFYPFYFTRKNQLASEAQFRDIRLALGYAAVVLLAGTAFYRRIRPRRGDPDYAASHASDGSLLFLSLFLAISYIAWQQVFSIYRYVAVLELLVPTFLALALNAWFRSRTVTLALSVILNLAIAGSVMRIDYGRQPFKDGFWKVRIPRVEELDKSAVLMLGEEATSFVVPSFPDGTRFVRVSSNFLYPGRNANLEQKITEMLAPYGTSRTLVYLSGVEETDLARRTLPYYGFQLEEGSCRELISPFYAAGYLCRVAAAPKPKATAAAPPTAEAAERAQAASPLQASRAASAPKGPESREPPESSTTPRFVQSAGVRLEITPVEAVAGEDTVEYRFFGLKARVVDLLFTVDGKPMPPVRNWYLSAEHVERVFVDSATRKGVYHIIGVRDSHSTDWNTWIRLDVTARIK